MSNPMVPPFQLLGPSNGPFPGTVCLPQVPLPTNWTMNPGDNATLQIVEIAAHGAALFSVCSLFFFCFFFNYFTYPLVCFQQANHVSHSVRRHHLRRARRRAHPPRQRDQLLQQLGPRLREHLQHHHHPHRQRRLPGHQRRLPFRFGPPSRTVALGRMVGVHARVSGRRDVVNIKEEKKKKEKVKMK